ncbi:MAG: phosphoserine phosphatase SerB, partial [Sphingomonas sp.]|nr:phosphoserine phosphatase SerB [Sphingomonas sp.]
MFIATLIAAERLQAGDISTGREHLVDAGMKSTGYSWIEEGIACDLSFEGDPAAARAALEGMFAGVDVIVQ